MSVNDTFRIYVGCTGGQFGPCANCRKIDLTEVSIAEFAKFVSATGYVMKAEQTGGMACKSGGVIKLHWNWRQPDGVQSDPEEPAVHITFDEAETFCKWRGNRLPKWPEWIR